MKAHFHLPREKRLPRWKKSLEVLRIGIFLAKKKKTFTKLQEEAAESTRQVRTRAPRRSGGGGRRSPSHPPSAVHSHKQRETLTNSKEFTTNSVVSMRCRRSVQAERGVGTSDADHQIGCSSRSFQAGQTVRAEKQSRTASLLLCEREQENESSSRTGCWYFYSRLQSLLACGLFAPVPSRSGARGLQRELYIQPRLPSPLLCGESARGLNETAMLRRVREGDAEEKGEERRASEYVRGRLFLSFSLARSPLFLSVSARVRAYRCVRARRRRSDRGGRAPDKGTATHM